MQNVHHFTVLPAPANLTSSNAFRRNRLLEAVFTTEIFPVLQYYRSQGLNLASSKGFWGARAKNDRTLQYYRFQGLNLVSRKGFWGARVKNDRTLQYYRSQGLNLASSKGFSTKKPSFRIFYSTTGPRAG